MKLNLKQWVAIALIIVTLLIILAFTIANSSGWNWFLFAGAALICAGAVLFVLFGKLGFRVVHVSIEDAIKDGHPLSTFCSAMPNYLGINLCSVDSFDVVIRKDGDWEHYHSIRVNFKDYKMSEDEKRDAIANGAKAKIGL